jgi:Dna[CI] antecedent, DciA
MSQPSITLSPRYPRALQPRQAIAVIDAVDAAPTLARLVSLAQESQQWLAAITPLVPPAMRSGVQAGPIENQQWCLLAANSAVAAKLRQLSPALAAHLRSKGWEIKSIRIKVQMGQRH